MDQAHPNAASIKGMLDDAAGNWLSPLSTQQQAATQGVAGGQAAAVALDAGACPEVRGHAARLCWSPSARSCTDLCNRNALSHMLHLTI